MYTSAAKTVQCIRCDDWKVKGGGLQREQTSEEKSHSALDVVAEILESWTQVLVCLLQKETRGAVVPTVVDQPRDTVHHALLTCRGI